MANKQSIQPPSGPVASDTRPMESALPAVSGLPAESTLPVMEQFYTLQGEGFHQGKAAYFIRLGGCDVGCVWCDVKESWDASLHPLKTISEIAEQVEYSCPPASEGVMVVITGGEPLLHDLNELTAQLKAKGYQTNIETSGSSPISGNWDWICLS